MQEFCQMLQKVLFGRGFGVLATIVHRIRKQKVFATSDNDQTSDQNEKGQIREEKRN